MPTETEAPVQEMSSSEAPEPAAEANNEQSQSDPADQQADTEGTVTDTTQPSEDEPTTDTATDPEAEKRSNPEQTTDQDTDKERTEEKQETAEDGIKEEGDVSSQIDGGPQPQPDQEGETKADEELNKEEPSSDDTPVTVEAESTEQPAEPEATSQPLQDKTTTQPAEEVKDTPTEYSKPTEETDPPVLDDKPEESQPQDEKETEPAASTDKPAVTEDKQELAESEPKQVETSRPGTDQNTKSKKEADKKDKKEKKKREKKKSRQASRDESSRKKSTAAAITANVLERILLTYFQASDLENSGHVDFTTFWETLQSAELNLQLGAEELTALRGLVEKDQSDLVNYAEFSSRATELISSLYKDKPVSDEHWVVLVAKDGSTTASYNKQTGETREGTGEDVDLFGGVIENLFQESDAGNKGYVTPEEFGNLLQSEQMAVYLTDEDRIQMQQYFQNLPEGKASYADFYPLGKELILRVYRAKDPSDSEWCQLDTPQGVIWFNKFTGETRRESGDDRQQEIAFLNQAYAEVEAVNFELEQYKAENKELQNQLAQAAEEQETLATQLYETGHHLDEASAEIEARNRELDEAREIIHSKDREIQEIMAQRGEFDAFRQKLEDTEYELRQARNTIAVRDQTVAERDSNMSEMQRTSDAITDKLKSAHGQVDAKDSLISSLKHKLNFQQMEAQKYEKQVAELEEKLSSTEQELATTKHTLDEKTTALTQARKHLKNSRERTLELEKDSEKLMHTQEKLRSSECEIRTLKSFLTTKTAMIEKNKKELRETRGRLSELQEKDRRRAVILADVLEKTARQFQQVGGSPTRQMPFESLQTPMEIRPASAPALPQDTEGDLIDGPEVQQSPSPRVMKSYTMSKGATVSPVYGVSQRSPPAKAMTKTKPRGRSKTVPKLPPIHKRHVQKQNSFVFPTQNDIRRQHWEQDQEVSDHVVSNPQCTCELCRMNGSVVGPSTLRPETGVTGQTGLSGFQSDMDPRDVAMARQLRNGQRVVIKMKKSEYDLEPQQLTGIVKYVGKVDSEFIDNRIYVGVKLDEPAGDTDGLIKGKRYFTCPAKHGKLVRISSVIAVLPNKSVFYKPLQGISKRSPYGGAAPKKGSTNSIRVV